MLIQVVHNKTNMILFSKRVVFYRAIVVGLIVFVALSMFLEGGITLGTIMLFVFTFIFCIILMSLQSYDILWEKTIIVDPLSNDFFVPIKFDREVIVKNIIIVFENSTGFYHGRIDRRVDSNRTRLFDLPIRKESSPSITRSPRELIYSWKSASEIKNIDLFFYLEKNVSSPRLLQALRGRRIVNTDQCVVDVIIKGERKTEPHTQP
jgi:hypothetical protein